MQYGGTVAETEIIDLFKERIDTLQQQFAHITDQEVYFVAPSFQYGTW